MEQNFLKDNEFGKLGEAAVKDLLERRNHKVEDVSDRHVAGDLLVDDKWLVEVKHQKCINNNRIYIELFTPNYKYGWFWKDQEVSFYCFYYNNLYIFIEAASLHAYFSAKFVNVYTEDYMFRKDKFGFSYEIIDIPDMIKYLSENKNLNYQIIDERQQLL